MAIRRMSPEDEPSILARIALTRLKWPKAIALAPQRDDIVLPDPDDVHVLSAAIEAGADTLITANRKDFPNRILSRYNVLPRDPDNFLHELASDNLKLGHTLLETLQQQAGANDIPKRTFLKKARLPRLAKLLS